MAIISDYRHAIRTLKERGKLPQEIWGVLERALLAEFPDWRFRGHKSRRLPELDIVCSECGAVAYLHYPNAGRVREPAEAVRCGWDHEATVVLRREYVKW